MIEQGLERFRQAVGGRPFTIWYIPARFERDEERWNFTARQQGLTGDGGRDRLRTAAARRACATSRRFKSRICHIQCVRTVSNVTARSQNAVCSFSPPLGYAFRSRVTDCYPPGALARTGETSKPSNQKGFVRTFLAGTGLASELRRCVGQRARTGWVFGPGQRGKLRCTSGELGDADSDRNGGLGPAWSAQGPSPDAT